MSDVALKIPAGYGLKLLDQATLIHEGDDLLRVLMDKLLIWEKPRYEHKYVVSVDVADGLGQDRTVADVLRIPTLTEPAEQVAQFITDSIDPVSFAPYLDVMGHMYHESDGTEAIMAIEGNGHGMSVHEELQRHYGYNNLYRWEYPDAADLKRRFSSKAGWWTNARTRAMMLSRLFANMKTYKTQEIPDLIVNSPHTIEEMQWFVVPPGYEMWAATAAAGRHDDAIFALAISVQVAHQMSIDDHEPIAETRRRLSEERARQEDAAARLESARDFFNSDVTVEEMEDYGTGIVWDRA